MASTTQGIANTGGLLISLNSSSPGNVIVGHLNKLLTNDHYTDIFLFNYKKDLMWWFMTTRNELKYSNLNQFLN